MTADVIRWLTARAGATSPERRGIVRLGLLAIALSRSRVTEAALGDGLVQARRAWNVVAVRDHADAPFPCPPATR